MHGRWFLDLDAGLGVDVFRVGPMAWVRFSKGESLLGCYSSRAEVNSGMLSQLLEEGARAVEVGASLDGWEHWGSAQPQPISFLASRADLFATRPAPRTSIEEIASSWELEAGKVSQPIARIGESWHHLEPASAEPQSFVAVPVNDSSGTLEQVGVVIDEAGLLTIGCLPFFAEFSLGSVFRRHRTVDGVLQLGDMVSLGERRLLRYFVNVPKTGVSMCRSDFSTLLRVRSHRFEWLGGGLLGVDVRKPFLVDHEDADIQALATSIGAKLRRVHGRFDPREIPANDW